MDALLRRFERPLLQYATRILCDSDRARDVVQETFVKLQDEIFFFQAEDGIRDVAVTGVQTCALPIYFDQLGLIPRVVSGNILNDTTGRARESDNVGLISDTERNKGIAHKRDDSRRRIDEIGRASCRERV